MGGGNVNIADPFQFRNLIAFLAVLFSFPCTFSCSLLPLPGKIQYVYLNIYIYTYTTHSQSIPKPSNSFWDMRGQSPRLISGAEFQVIPKFLNHLFTKFASLSWLDFIPQPKYRLKLGDDLLNVPLMDVSDMHILKLVPCLHLYPHLGFVEMQMQLASNSG